MYMSKSPPHWRVLVIPGATEIGLEINRALRDCKEVELYSAGENVPSAAMFRFRRHFEAPSVLTAEGIAAVNEIVISNGIDFIYPAHDDVVLRLGQLGAIGPAVVLGSPAETCETTRFKSRTYEALADLVPVPRVFIAPPPADAYPVFVKPDRGQGSAGAQLIRTEEELERAKLANADLLVSEYLPGDEFTVDCFTDNRGNLLFAGPRTRTRTRAGISVQSRCVEGMEFQTFASSINARLRLRGGWFFQVKRARSGALTLLEVAPRIAGTMALNRVLGTNFPLMTIYDAAGLTVRPLNFQVRAEIARTLDNHYNVDLHFTSVYVDLDDTLIIDNKVNTRLLRLLYQCFNEGKPINLLTRHRYSIPDTLSRYRIQHLFDDVIYVPEDCCKSEFISDPSAIFIDDSFRERLLVSKLGVKTFDPSAIECLLDERS